MQVIHKIIQLVDVFFYSIDVSSLDLTSPFSDVVQILMSLCLRLETSRCQKIENLDRDCLYVMEYRFIDIAYTSFKKTLASLNICLMRLRREFQQSLKCGNHVHQHAQFSRVA